MESAQRIGPKWVSCLWDKEANDLVGFMGFAFGPMNEREEQVLRMGFSLGCQTAAESLGCELVGPDEETP